MSSADQAIAAIILASIAVLAAIIIAYWIGYRDGWHEGRASEHARQSRRRIKANQAAAAPRPPEDGPPWYLKIEARAVPGTTRRHVTAIPPQPRRDSGAGTIRMPRLTDTGEFRAIAARGTDDYIERIQAEGDIYRAQLREAMAQ
jgi:hypothetical protein